MRIPHCWNTSRLTRNENSPRSGITGSFPQGFEHVTEETVGLESNLMPNSARYKTIVGVEHYEHSEASLRHLRHDILAISDYAQARAGRQEGKQTGRTVHSSCCGLESLCRIHCTDKIQSNTHKLERPPQKRVPEVPLCRGLGSSPAGASARVTWVPAL